MKKLTKHQRQYRKRKKESKKDIVRLPKPFPGAIWPKFRLARRQLCIRINSDASEKLTAMCQSESITQWEMVSRLINYKLKSYSTVHNDDGIESSWTFDDDLQDSEVIKDQKIKYKGTKGSKQLNISITWPAYQKLEEHKQKNKLSKARIIQYLILSYKPPSEKLKEQRKRYYEEFQRSEDSWTAERQRQGEVPYKKKSKFIDIGDEYIHVKLIKPEMWDDDEVDEYCELMDKKLEYRKQKWEQQKADNADMFDQRIPEATKEILDGEV